jgi:hypothetical protein
VFREMTVYRVGVVKAQASASGGHRLVVRSEYDLVVWHAVKLKASLRDVFEHVFRKLVPAATLKAVMTEQELRLDRTPSPGFLIAMSIRPEASVSAWKPARSNASLTHLHSQRSRPICPRVLPPMSIVGPKVRSQLAASRPTTTAS